MPRKKKIWTRSLPPGVVVKKYWVVYSTNRVHCFAVEIAKGYFGPDHRCGCESCDLGFEMPKPEFTRLPGETRPPQLFDPKPGD